MSLPALIFVFLQNYLVPLLFAIGLLYFIYAFIEYFIVGKGGDEGRAQHGRVLFLKSIAWFSLALLAHLLVILFVWIASIAAAPSSGSATPGGEFRRDEAILKVPNVPTREQ